MSDATELLTLHALRLRSLCSADVVAARFDLDPTLVAAVLDDAARRDLVQHRDGRLSGWSLTTDGRHFAEQLLADELGAAGTSDQVAAAYVEFLELNPQVLTVCADWQVVEVDGQSVVNDHSDPARDERVLDRLSSLHARALPVTYALGGALARMDGYAARLTHAHDSVIAGDHQWLTKPTIDSYHSVWFELHEDLLATLGRSRTDERTAAAAADEQEANAERAAEEYA